MEWITVCQSADIGVEVARAITIQDRRLVVWRDGGSGIHVWDDYCPHRGLELSEGQVSGGLITCPAHGWRFDANGQLVRPLTSSAPCRDAVFAQVYAAREEKGIVSACLAQTVTLPRSDIKETLNKT